MQPPLYVLVRWCCAWRTREQRGGDYSVGLEFPGELLAPNE
jgi:hypothetical protein